MKKILMAVASMLAATELFAVPACPKPFEAEQSDGTRITLRKRGDEFLKWHEDADGYTVVQDAASKDWFYAELDSTATMLVPSKVRVGSGTKGLSVVRHLLPPSGIQRANGARRLRTGGGADKSSYLKPSANVRQLVVLVEFTDVKLTKTKAQFEQLFNTIGYSADGNAGSVRDFYREISYGKTDLQSTVVGPITLPNNMAYYGGNDVYGDDANSSRLGIDAAKVLHDQGFDFAPYDTDGDGWLDELDIIHAGHGEEYGGSASDNIWSCRWTWRSYFAIYDGVKFGGFHTEPEMRGASSSKITQVGVICHELGHSFGLPDLYDTTYSSEGAGDFCLMAGGSWGAYGSNDDGTCPSHMSAWCKQKLGWLTPTEITAAGQYSLARVEDNAKVYKLRDSGFGAQEYFLFENRTATGFDRGTPGSTKGMLIWHVDDSQSDNDNVNHYMVDLEEASGTQHMELSPYSSSSNRGADSDYFRSTTKTSFTSTTTPNNKSYNGTAPSWSISGISAAGGTMSFTVTGIGPDPDPDPDPLPDAPVISIGTYGTTLANASYIKVTWGSVSGATSYDIYRSTTTTRPNSPFASNVTSPYMDYKATSGLQPGVRYYYWVSAKNAAGASYSNSDWGNILVSLTLDKSSVNFGASGGRATVSVTANTAWEIEKTGYWFATSTSGTSGNGSVSLTATANNDTSPLSGTLKVTAGKGTSYPASVTVSVCQDGKEPEPLPEFVIVNNVLVGYNGNGGTVTIPSEAHAIEEGVFRNNESVTKVVTPNTMVWIGGYAFYGCTSLAEVELNEGLESIGMDAFGNCRALTELTLPSTLEAVGDYAFIGCSSLRKVTYLGSAAPTVESAIYRGTPTTLVSHVQEGSTGWDGTSGSKVLPSLFPADGGADGRAIMRPGPVPAVKPTLTISTRGDDALTDRIVVQWTLVSGEAYNIYRSTANVRPSVALATGVCPPYTDLSTSGLEAGVTYYYWVEANSGLTSEFSDSAWGNIKEEPAVPEQPVIVAAEGDYDGISLTWASAFGAESYAVYRSTVSGQIGTKISGTLAGYTYRDTSCTAGIDYWYTVAAVNAYGATYSAQVRASRLVKLDVTDLIVLPPEGGSKSFSFAFQNGYSMNKSGFFSTSTQMSSGQCTVTVSADENDTGAKRSGSIVLTVGTGTSHPTTRTIVVEQDYVKDVPPPESEDGLTLHRFWPDNTEAHAEGQFVLAAATSQLKFKVTDADYGREITDYSYFKIYDSEYGDWIDFTEGNEIPAGTVRFRLSLYAGFYGTRAVKVSVSADGGTNWTESKAVRVIDYDNGVVWGNGEETFYDGSVAGVTNTTLAANGISTWGDKQVYMYNADDVVAEEGRISTNTLWTAEKLHVLRGDVVIPSGVMLTIANGTSVRRFDGYSKIHVQKGGAIRLQGVSFESVYEQAQIFGESVDSFESASSVVEFDEDMTSTLVGRIHGNVTDATTYATVFAFSQDYTEGEVVGDLPVPSVEVAGCTFGGWTYKNDDGQDVAITPETPASNIIDADYLELQADPQWIPAMPTDIYAITSGSEIEPVYYGRKVIIRWNKVISSEVTGYTVQLFRAGQSPFKTESVDQPYEGTVAEYECFDLQGEWGIYGGEKVFCRVCATTESGTGMPLEFSFDLPLVLELSPSAVSVENLGVTSESLAINANVQWTVQSLNSWITATASEYGSTVYYSVDATDSMYERTGYVEVAGGGATRRLIVTQNGDPEKQTKVTDPVISPMDGTAFTNASCEVTIACDTAGAQIRYTTDGSDPSASHGTVYASSFEITTTTEIRAIAVKDGLATSEIVRSRITKLVPDSGTDIQVNIGGGRTISIPKSWLETYYPELVGMPVANYGSVALSKTGKYDCEGNELAVWADYVAGTIPTDKTSQFKVTAITVDGGTVQIDWEPKNVAGRTYTLSGKADLGDGNWTPISPSQTSGYKFFKVTVDLQ